MKTIIDFLKKHPILTAVIGVLVAFFGTKLITPSDGVTYKLAASRIALAFTMFVFLYLISREKTFDKCTKTTGYVIKKLLPTLILPVLVAAFALFTGFQSGETMRSDWPLELIASIVLYLFVGLFEETTFRAMINDAMIETFRNTKGIFFLIAVVTSLVFGAVHVIGADLADPTARTLSILKTLSAGIGGLCYLFLYWKTRNLWGIAIMHGLFDFMASVSTVFFASGQEFASGADRYAAVGQNPIVGYATYGIQILVNAVIALILYFKVAKKIDFKELRETW